jgi:hypothetical protein
MLRARSVVLTDIQEHLFSYLETQVWGKMKMNGAVLVSNCQFDQ